MNGELDDPRSVQYSYYRWNPFTNKWEFWDHLSDGWFISITLAGANVTHNLASWKMELSYEDTWAEPFFGEI